MKHNFLGFPPKEPSPPQSPTKFGYTQSLLAKFNLPISRPVQLSNPTGGTASSVTEFYSLLASAISGATSRDLSFKNLIRNLSPGASSAERLSFISAQRERLVMLLSALEKEENALQTDLNACTVDPKVPGVIQSGIFSETDEASEMLKGSISRLRKSYSEIDFEKIEVDPTSNESESADNQTRKNFAGGSWFPWIWRPQIEEGHVGKIPKDKGRSQDEGKSSSVDP